MIESTTNYIIANSSPTRTLKAKVELFNGSTLVNTFTQDDNIISIDIQRVGESSKFFGFGILHKVTIKLIDSNRQLNISKGEYFKISLGLLLDDNTIEYKTFPNVYVNEVNRNEVSNQLSIVAFDKINDASAIKIGDLELIAPYDITYLCSVISTELGVTLNIPESYIEFNLSYNEGANFDGTETLREVLNMIAEATLTIYFINSENKLTFKRLNDIYSVENITKEKYFNLKGKGSIRLQTIASITDLGDNISTSAEGEGITQYVKNNGLWELREDIATLLDNAIKIMGGVSFNQFECMWRGNPALEIGDKIALVTKDDEVIYSYLLNDTLTYNGGLKQNTEWSYKEESESASSNPTTLGEALKQTYAKVDKANKQIELFVSETESKIVDLTNETNSKLSEISQDLTSSTESTNAQIVEITQSVQAMVTKESLDIEIKKQISEGATKVDTGTGYKFDDTGLHVKKTDSEMETTVDEDGLDVKRNGEDILTADSRGVDAINLTARKYLIIGTNSRLEDFGNRTACFWIGDEF